jgi:hypothetical protein
MEVPRLLDADQREGAEVTRSVEERQAFTMKVPMIGALTAASVEDLADKFAEARDEGGYGASDIGSRWPVRDGHGKHTATVCYNGRIIWEAA